MAAEEVSVGDIGMVVAGAVLGIAGALPSAALLERALRHNTASVAAGLASTMISFSFLSLSVLAVRIAAREQLLAFGTAEAASFLFVWVCEAARGWRDAQSDVDARRKEAR